MDLHYSKTGHEWDETREKEFKALTNRIEHALIRIGKDLTSYKTKPTIEDLAKLSKPCSKGILVERAKRDAKLNPVAKLDDFGHVVKDEKDTPIYELYGWPLSELRRLQNLWRLSKNNFLKPQKKQDAPALTALSEVEELRKRIRRYQGQISELKYQVEDGKDKNKQLEKSLDMMEITRERMEAENRELKEKLLKRRDGSNSISSIRKVNK